MDLPNPNRNTDTNTGNAVDNTKDTSVNYYTRKYVTEGWKTWAEECKAKSDQNLTLNTSILASSNQETLYSYFVNPSVTASNAYFQTMNVYGASVNALPSEGKIRVYYKESSDPSVLENGYLIPGQQIRLNSLNLVVIYTDGYKTLAQEVDVYNKVSHEPGYPEHIEISDLNLQNGVSYAVKVRGNNDYVETTWSEIKRYASLNRLTDLTVSYKLLDAPIAEMYSGLPVILFPLKPGQTYYYDILANKKTDQVSAKTTTETEDGVELTETPISLSYQTTEDSGIIRERLKNRIANKEPAGVGVPLRNYTCYFAVLAGNSIGIDDYYYLPVIPEEFSERASANFQSEQPLGRSVAYRIYNSTNKSYSFSIQLHSDLTPEDPDYIYLVVNKLQSVCFPEYSNTIVLPPEIIFVVGNHFRVRGVVSSVDVSWKLPMIGNTQRYSNCVVNLSIDETTGPYSMSDITHMNYGQHDIR